MNCENCKQPHDGTFASGRFCNSKCARGFSSKAKRLEINAKISQALKGKTSPHKGKNYSWSIEAKDRVKSKKIIESEMRWKTAPFESIQKGKRRDRILLEQNGKCSICKIEPEWMGNKLTFQLDHISGNRADESRSNLRLICPNCHSQTSTWGSKNASPEGKKRILAALTRGARNRNNCPES